MKSKYKDNRQHYGSRKGSSKDACTFYTKAFGSYTKALLFYTKPFGSYTKPLLTCTKILLFYTRALRCYTRALRCYTNPTLCYILENVGFLSYKLFGEQPYGSRKGRSKGVYPQISNLNRSEERRVGKACR